MARPQLKGSFNRPLHEQVEAFVKASQTGDNKGIVKFVTQFPEDIDTNFIHHAYVGYTALSRAARPYRHPRRIAGSGRQGG